MRLTPLSCSGMLAPTQAHPSGECDAEAAESRYGSLPRKIKGLRRLRPAAATAYVECIRSTRLAGDTPGTRQTAHDGRGIVAPGGSVYMARARERDENASRARATMKTFIAHELRTRRHELSDLTDAANQSSHSITAASVVMIQLGISGGATLSPSFKTKSASNQHDQGRVCHPSDQHDPARGPS